MKGERKEEEIGKKKKGGVDRAKRMRRVEMSEFNDWEHCETAVKSVQQAGR